MTLTPLSLSLLIVLGACLQFAWMVAPWRREDGMVVGLLVFVSAMSIVFTALKGRDPLSQNILFTGLMMLIISSAFFRDRILPRLEEGSVLVWTALLVYALYCAYGAESLATRLAFSVGLVVVITLLQPRRLSFATKLLVYVWCLFAVVIIAGLQLRWGDLVPVIADRESVLSPFIAVIDGMALMYCGAHAWWLINLIPLPSRYQSFDSRLREWHRDTEAMVERLSDAQVHPWLGVAVLTCVAACMALNEILEWMDPWLLIRCLLIGIPPLAWALQWLHRYWDPPADPL